MSIKKIRRKADSLLLALLLFSLSILMIGPAIPTQAARATGTVKNRILNVRSSASTSSSIVCKLTKGTKVNIISETTGDDGLKWYNVYFAYNGDAKEGFVRADLVTVSGSVSGSSGSTTSSSGSTASNSSTKYVKPNVAIIRTYASTNGDVRSRLEKGTAVTVLSSKTGDDKRTWYKISFSKNGTNMDGYIRGDLLTDTNPGGSASGSSASGTRYVKENSVSVRTYASVNADIRSTLTQGTQVSLISSKTGDDGKLWYKVSYQNNGSTLNGYIRSDMLANEKPSSGSSSGNGSSGTAANTSAAIKPVVANIRSYASTNADIRSKLSQGTGVQILSEKTGDDGKKWYKISYTYNGSSMDGYIRSDLLNIGTTGTTSSGSSSSGSSSSSSGGSSNAIAQVRTYASPNADIRTTLENGTKVTILKEKTGDDGQKWTKISFTQNGKKMEGYIPSSLLK